VTLQNAIKDWTRPIYYLSQTIISLIGVVLTTSSAVNLVGFWIYDFMLPELRTRMSAFCFS
jgi:hypothetical protein